MTTLKDLLKDFAKDARSIDTYDKTEFYDPLEEKLNELIEEYIENIKNNLIG